MDQIRDFKSGRSPFDRIRHLEDDGREYWTGRELAPELGYADWRNFESVVEKAKWACRHARQQVADHFVDVNEMVSIGGSKSMRGRANYVLTRYACHLIALSGDSSKRQVAEAKHYFAVMTRVAETNTVVIVKERPAAPVRASWSERLNETTGPHFCHVNIHHPGFFSVISAATTHILMMEDELLRHMLPVGPGDLPDGSIGRRWADHRRAKGLPESKVTAPLLMPSRGAEVHVLLYPFAELGDYVHWLMNDYIPKYLPEYFGNKHSFRPYGQLPPASAADHASLRISGRNAEIKPKLRKQLVAVGGFAPVGTEVPALPGLDSAQGNFFDLLS